MKKEFENLTEDVQEYIGRRVDNIKMRIVEELSVIMGDMLASLVIFIMLFTAFLFILIGVVTALAYMIGFVYAMVLAGGIIIAVSAIIYLSRAWLFVDTIVKHLCRLLAVRKEVDNE